MPDLSKLGVTMAEATQGAPGLSEMLAATMTGAAQGGARLGAALADAMVSTGMSRPDPAALRPVGEGLDRA